MKKLIILAIIFLQGFGYAQEIPIRSGAKTITDFPWTEGFESATFPPEGWTILDVSGEKTWTQASNSTGYVHSGSKSAGHDFAPATAGLQATALITPAITLPDSGSPELDFWSYIHLIGYNNSSKILISTTVNDNMSAFTEVKTLSGDEAALAAWRNIVIPLDDYISETIYIAFLYTAIDGPRWFIDDVTVSHFDSYVDMQAVSMTPVTGTYALLTDNVPVTVRLKNNGGNPESGFALKLWHNDNLMATETFTGSIPSLGEVNYTFNYTLNLSAVATHKIQAVVEIAGDQVPANDMVTAMVTNLGCGVVTTFPFEEGFEDHGTNLPPDWTQEFVDGPIQWQVMHNAPSLPISPETAYEGNYRAVFYYGAYDRVTKLVTPPLDLSSLNNPALKFYHTQQLWDADLDTLTVYYRTSTLSNWLPLAKYTCEVFDWTEEIISLPEPSNQYYIAFEGYHNWGRSIQLDNIFIGDFFETDIAVIDINPKGTHLNLSETQQITTTIKNKGRDPVSGFTVSLFVNETPIATENYPGSIQGMEEADYTFNATANLSTSGYYDIKVVVYLPGDEIPEDDELTVTVRNLVCDALTFPHDEGFEEEVFPPYCWTTVGQSWERRTYGGHESISRAVCPWWKGNEAWLISPKFSIPENGNYLLEFWSECYDAKFYSYSGVWISTTNNNPSSFVEVHELTSNERPEDEWVKIEIPLNNYAGQNIYIGFKYTTPNIDNGHMWSVDDFLVSDLDPRIDAELVAIIMPPDLGINLTNTEEVTVKIKNNGGASISNFQLKLELNGAEVVTENYVGFINSLATGTYTFTKKLDLSAAGMHSVKVTVILENDMDPSNDSKTKTVENRICEVVTDFPWVGAFQGTAPHSIDDCWVNRDADGDTKKWWSLEENGKYYAISESYDAQYEFELTPDNWLITPPLALNQNEVLSYKVGGANSATSGAEKYSLLISTTNIEPASFTPIHTETLSSYDYTEFLNGSLAGYGVKTVNIPLASYTGKTVHLAFRHWDCTNQDKLILTDITVNKSVGITENEFTNVLVYSQQNSIYIIQKETEQISSIQKVEIMDMMGRIIHQDAITQVETKITLQAASGVYVVRLILHEGKTILKKVFIK